MKGTNLDNQQDKPPRSPAADSNEKKTSKKSDKKKTKSTVNWVWAIKVAVISITASVLMTLLSTEVLQQLNLAAAFIILIIFIIINIFFDIIAIAITTADIKPFLSMSARRLKVGITGVYLINNAEKMNNICADVIGDIAGVVSGATGTAIMIRIFTNQDSEFIGNLIITSLIAGLTVGGKALGKSIGIRFSYNIVYGTAKVFGIFLRKKTNENKDTK